MQSHHISSLSLAHVVHTDSFQTSRPSHERFPAANVLVNFFFLFFSFYHRLLLMWETRAQLCPVFREMPAGWLANRLSLCAPLDAYVSKVNETLVFFLLKVHLGTHSLV